MDISKEDAQRLREIADEMNDLLNEYKGIVRSAMTHSEFDRFRYNTLANLEPGLTSDHTWVVGSHVKSLDSIADTALEDATDEDEEEEDEEEQRQDEKNGLFGDKEDIAN